MTQGELELDRNYIKRLEDHIKKLESPKTCEGCKYNENYEINSVQKDKWSICTISSRDCSRLKKDYYEAKDK